MLPDDPRIGQLLGYKLSQEVTPRANDRFTIELGLQPPPLQPDVVRLYQLDVLLFHDTARAPLKAGTVVVAVPYVPDKGFFLAGRSHVGGGRERPEQESTHRSAAIKQGNEKALRRMLNRPGERPPELNRNLLDVPVTGDEADLCLPSGKPRTPGRAQPPLSDYKTQRSPPSPD